MFQSGETRRKGRLPHPVSLPVLLLAADQRQRHLQKVREGEPVHGHLRRGQPGRHAGPVLLLPDHRDVRGEGDGAREDGDQRVLRTEQEHGEGRRDQGEQRWLSGFVLSDRFLCQSVEADW